MCTGYKARRKVDYTLALILRSHMPIAHLVLRQGEHTYTRRDGSNRYRTAPDVCGAPMVAVKRHVTFSRYRLRFLCAFQTAGKVSVQHGVNIIWEISRWKLEYNSPVFHPLYAMLHCKRNLSFKPRDVERPWQSIVDVPWVSAAVTNDFISFHFISHRAHLSQLFTQFVWNLWTFMSFYA